MLNFFSSNSPESKLNHFFPYASLHPSPFATLDVLSTCISLQIGLRLGSGLGQSLELMSGLLLALVLGLGLGLA